jgi:hypothetical protein
MLGAAAARQLTQVKPGRSAGSTVISMSNAVRWSILVGAVLGLAAMQPAHSQASVDEVGRAYQAVTAAHLSLDQAESERLQGIEPLPGERLGTVRPGQSRLSEKYWKRQAELEEHVARSRKRLDEALARWRAVQ